MRTESGWSKLPGRKDMAKLQFGDSFCQIEGLYVPVADMNLAAPDSVYFTHHVLLWKDPHIKHYDHAAGWRLEAPVRGYAADHDPGARAWTHRILA